jgi:hypothetical protein
VTAGKAASIHARLKNLSDARGGDFNRILERYAIERWLYRLSRSEARERLFLKGAMLFDLWFEAPHRPTRDADFLGHGPDDIPTLETLVREVCAIACDDGLSFDMDSLAVETIREEARYGGLRARLTAKLGNARIPMQLDVGFGDAVTPAADEVEYPVLLNGLPAPKLKVYPRATVVAEKLEAIVSLGITNSRMKDYFDLLALVREGALDPETLVAAIAATFQRRGTEFPLTPPIGLSPEFVATPGKVQLWTAFLARNRLEGPPLAAVVAELGAYFAAPFEAARRRNSSR